MFIIYFCLFCCTVENWSADFFRQTWHAWPAFNLNLFVIPIRWEEGDYRYNNANIDRHCLDMRSPPIQSISHFQFQCTMNLSHQISIQLIDSTTLLKHKQLNRLRCCCFLFLLIFSQLSDLMILQIALFLLGLYFNLFQLLIKQCQSFCLMSAFVLASFFYYRFSWIVTIDRKIFFSWKWQIQTNQSFIQRYV